MEKASHTARNCLQSQGPKEYVETIEGFHVTSQQPNRASHAIHSRHVGSFFALSGIGKSHKICSHSLLLNLHKAKLHSNNVIYIYLLTANLTCSNKISKKLKHILLFFPVSFLYCATQKNIQHGVGTKCARGTASWKPSITPLHVWRQNGMKWRSPLITSFILSTVFMLWFFLFVTSKMIQNDAGGIKSL